MGQLYLASSARLAGLPHLNQPYLEEIVALNPTQTATKLLLQSVSRFVNFLVTKVLQIDSEIADILAEVWLLDEHGGSQ